MDLHHGFYDMAHLVRVLAGSLVAGASEETMTCASVHVTQAVGSHHEQPRGGRTKLTEEGDASKIHASDVQVIADGCPGSKKIQRRGLDKAPTRRLPPESEKDVQGQRSKPARTRFRDPHPPPSFLDEVVILTREVSSWVSQGILYPGCTCVADVPWLAALRA
ncbi:hypothetical protein C0Q70_01810 [Pomacea canaliculata]|uniref:Uncharacterized protein n=1 Tax=Pomacea canaliculata TaxID=400727 RepID=A0A2T7Q0I4_POMCA|nr:hypothetical protein C0Q70_01810 [Pomacea canaliculata]